jgi:hypothetical protein
LGSLSVALQELATVFHIGIYATLAGIKAAEALIVGSVDPSNSAPSYTSPR